MSVHLLLDSVSFAYSDAVEVLDAVSLHLTPGWTGMVGPNFRETSVVTRAHRGAGFLARRDDQAYAC